MSASQGERTEAATPKRLRDARQKGQVPRSQELSTAVLLIGAALAVRWMGDALGQMLTSVMHYSLLMIGAGELTPQGAVGLLHEIGWKALAGIGAFTTALLGFGVFISGAQARAVLTMEPLKPQWKRLSPIQNAKQKWGLQALVEFAKSLAKIGIIGWAVYASIAGAWDEILALAQQHPFAFAPLLYTYADAVLMNAGLAYLVLGLLDYAYQVKKHTGEMKMTHQEVKDEYKQNEGDPLIKAQRRAMARAMIRKQMLGDVARATLVLRNPTHIAVAIRYDPAEAPAPIVVAMGRNKLAERIIALAEEAGVPCVENVPLARALFRASRVGDQIPPDLYIAVADVLAFVIRQRKKR